MPAGTQVPAGKQTKEKMEIKEDIKNLLCEQKYKEIRKMRDLVEAQIGFFEFMLEKEGMPSRVAPYKKLRGINKMFSFSSGQEIEEFLAGNPNPEAVEEFVASCCDAIEVNTDGHMSMWPVRIMFSPILPVAGVGVSTPHVAVYEKNAAGEFFICPRPKNYAGLALRVRCPQCGHDTVVGAESKIYLCGQCGGKILPILKDWEYSVINAKGLEAAYEVEGPHPIQQEGAILIDMV